MNPRSVALLTVASPPGPPQGVAAYSAALVGALAPSEFDITVWSQRQTRAAARQDRGEEAIGVWRPGILAGPDLFRQLRRMRPDLLHVQFEFGIYGGTLGLLSLLGALALGRAVFKQRVVVTLHQVPSARDLTAEWLRRSGIYLPAWAGRLVVRSVVSTLRRSSDRLIVHADVFRDRLRSEWGVGSPPEVVPHGVALTGQASGPDEETADAPGVDARGADAHRLLLFGYLKWYKGIEIAIEAFRRLAGEFPQWTLTIAGPSTSDAYLEMLRRVARSLGSRVEFLGRVDDDRVTDLFRHSGVVLLPYRRLFSASGPLAQALGHAVPFVISEELRPLCPGWPHWARPDPEEWARVLRPLMSDGAVRATAGRLAAALAQGWGWPMVAERTLEIYRVVLS